MASREDRIEEKLREFMKVCLVLNVVSLRSVSPGTPGVLCSDSSGQSPGLAGQGGLQEGAELLPPEHLLQQHVQHGRSHNRDVHPKLLQTPRHFRENLKKAKIRI